MTFKADSLEESVSSSLSIDERAYLINCMLIQVLDYHSRGESVDVLGQSPHVSSIGVRY
jgi:hypothetical protein